MKKITGPVHAMGPLQLDSEVCALVTRIGSLNRPGDHISKYEISREVGDVVRVTVVFIADELFSKVETSHNNDSCDPTTCIISTHGHTP